MQHRPGRVDPPCRATVLAGEGVRMASLSVASLMAGYLLTMSLVRLLGLDPRQAYSIAVVTVSIANFFGCRYYVFRGTRAPMWQEALKFFPSVLAFRAMEVALFSAFDALWSNYHVAYFATAVISMVAKFTLSKIFIFRRPSP